MSKELMYVLIAKMHIRLNKLIEKNNFNLQNNEVQHYSRRLDKVLTHYDKVLEENKYPVMGQNPLNIVKKYLISL